MKIGGGLNTRGTQKKRVVMVAAVAAVLDTVAEGDMVEAAAEAAAAVAAVAEVEYMEALLVVLSLW